VKEQAYRAIKQLNKLVDQIVSCESKAISNIATVNYNLIQKQPSCKKKCVAPKEAIVQKRCEIQGGGQEMAVMVS